MIGYYLYGFKNDRFNDDCNFHLIWELLIVYLEMIWYTYMNLKMIISMMIGLPFVMGIADDLVHFCKFENDCFDDDR